VFQSAMDSLNTLEMEEPMTQDCSGMSALDTRDQIRDAFSRAFAYALILTIPGMSLF
jgi:hypothetical protein